MDGLLGEAVATAPAAARADRASYITYLMAPVEAAERPPVGTFDESYIRVALDAVAKFGQRKFIVLAGIPGTGKTRLAKLIADQLPDGDSMRRKDIQFHESTTYEDFVEGFVPRPDGQGFERRDKTLRIINQRALDDPSRAYVLVFEELTRGNAHAVLGELLTYVEHRKQKFTLAISQDETSIASNLVVLVTMNPRDRSALTLDDAVTRRMHRINVPSSTSALASMLDGSLHAVHMKLLHDWFKKILIFYLLGMEFSLERTVQSHLKTSGREQFSRYCLILLTGYVTPSDLHTIGALLTIGSVIWSIVDKRGR